MSSERKPDLHLEIAHVLFMDVVAFSKLLINDQSEILEQLNKIVRDTPQFRAAEAADKLVRLATGDGIALVFFNSAEAPVECALEISQALKSCPQIKLRMGVHSGPVNAVSDVNDRSNVTGAGINMAQRVMDCGDAGHILVSKRVAEDLAQYRQWQPCLHDLGEYEVKHGVRVSVVNLCTKELGNSEVPEKFQLAKEKEQTAAATRSPARSKSLLITLAILICLLFGFAIVAVIFAPAATKFFSHQRAATTPHPAPAAASIATASAVLEKSIAVLPFENLSRDPDNAYFTEGVQEEILTRLAKIGELKVISRTSTQRYKSSPDDLPQIAKQLGVAHILEGTVQKANDRVRVHVQLINAATDAHLWADTFDRKLTDIFDVESDIAKTVAETLKAKLSGSESHAVAAHPTDNPEAYQLYLRGRYFWNKRTGDNLAKSLQYFEQAIAADQYYALAYAGLADTYVLLPSYTGAPWEENFAKARVAAKKALDLNETLAEPHVSLAEVFCQRDLDLTQSLKEFRRAIELNPNYATAHSWNGRTLLAAGHFDDAISEIRRAVELDPFSVIINSQLAYAYVIARDTDEAIDQSRKIIEMEPNFYWGHSLLGRALQLKGDLPGAISEMEKARQLDNDPQVIAWLAHAYAAAGRKDETLKSVHDLQDLLQGRPSASYYLAIAYVALNKKEEALQLLEKNFENPTTDMSGMKIDPHLQSLHGDPRFERLASKILSKEEK